jgi:hypothetical protein
MVDACPLPSLVKSEQARRQKQKNFIDEKDAAPSHHAYLGSSLYANRCRLAVRRSSIQKVLDYRHNFIDGFKPTAKFNRRYRDEDEPAPRAGLIAIAASIPFIYRAS